MPLTDHQLPPCDRSEVQRPIAVAELQSELYNVRLNLARLKHAADQLREWQTATALAAAIAETELAVSLFELKHPELC